jgi:hypothetical protein
MRETLNAELIQRVAKATVGFFQGKRQGTGVPADHIAGMSGVSLETVQRVFAEHWGIRSIHGARLNMTKQQYERIQTEALPGAVLASSACRGAHEDGDACSGVGALCSERITRAHLLDALRRELDAASLPQQQKDDAKLLLRKLAEIVGPAVFETPA